MGCFAAEAKRSAASHEDAKHPIRSPRCAKICQNSDLFHSFDIRNKTFEIKRFLARLTVI